MSSYNPPPGATSPYAAGGSASPPPKKSKALLIIGLIVGFLGIGSLACCGSSYFLFSMGASVITTELTASPILKNEIGTTESITMNFQRTGQEADAREEPGILAFDVKGSKGSGVIVCKTGGGGGNSVEWAVLVKPDGTEVEIIGDGPAVDMGGAVESDSPF